MSSYTEEIVWTETEDGINHAGIVIRPDGQPPKPLALIWVHGFTGRFYESQSIKIGREVACQGYTFVSGNNRGHHVGTNLRKKGSDPILGGGWWEHLDESPYDVAAWIDFTFNLGFAHMVVIGHSLGALKVPYYQARRQDPRIAGIVAASPPIRTVVSHADPALLELARELAANGR